MVSMRAMREPAVLMRCGIMCVGFAVIVFAVGCTMVLSRSEAILYLIVTGALLLIGIAALAEVRRRYESHALESKKTGRHMPVHVRRAHWHGSWTGPKDNPTGLEIKWIAPIIVNADKGDVQGVIHQL